MTTFQALLTDLRTQFQRENEEIKNKIKGVEESLQWNEVPSGRGSKEFRMLNTREAKLKTIHTLREQLINNADEMEEFQRTLQEILTNPENMVPKLHREIQTFKKHLPIYRFRSQIMDTVQNYDVTILVADTGSGKSTLLPQFLHDHNEKHVIYCAQPRRLAANALADYTRECLDVGNEGSAVAVDYSSWDTTYKLGTSRIVYTTNFGLLHKWRKDKYLSDVDIVVIDEAHERNLATDLLLGIMKEVITAKYTRNNPIKLVIMSATIDPSIFYNFFAQDTTRVKNLSIPGKTFPINIIYNNEPISDNPREYLERTLKKIKEIVHENEVGDILAFLATPAEIDECVDNLEDHFQKMERNIKAYPLHGNVESETQRALFKKDLNINEQRVILATKIAETSVTLPDISFVVDSGRQKEYIYDLIKNIGELSLCRISKSSGIQRAGRAGRVGPGVCYRLYTLKDFDDFVSCQSPQIKCLPLDQSLLSLFDLGFSSPSSFHFIDPPDPAAIKVGITSLVSLNALDEIKTVEEGNVSYQLTTIGHKMAKFNIDPRLSHLIVNTIELERDYIYEILVICGMVSFGGNIFYRYGNIEAADIQKLKFCHPSGDFITMLEAYKRWIIVPNNEQRVWSKKNFVSPKALLSVRKFVSRSIKQIEKTYRSYNFANLKSLNFNHTNCYDTILKLIYNSFKRSVGIFAGHYKTGYLSPVTCEKMVLHGSSSINKLSCELPQYICFDKVMTTTKTFIFHASAVKPEWIEDKDSLYTQFVKSSMVEHYTDFPKLGSKFLRYKIIRNIKSETPRLQESIKNNSLVKQVTSFYDIYVHIERGQIDVCCHPENKSILITLLNEIIEYNVQMAKSERMEIPVYGTKIFMNLGVFGIVSEITIPGNFLSIKLPLYRRTSGEVKKYVKMVTSLKSMPRFQLNTRNPHEPELFFTAVDDAKKAFELISEISSELKPRWAQNKSNSGSLSIRIYLNMNQFSSDFGEDVIKEVQYILGDSLKQNVELSVVDNARYEGRTDVLIEAYSVDFANAVMEKIKTSILSPNFRRFNVCIKSSWIVPNKVVSLLQIEITKLFKSDCKFDPRERNTRVEVFKKQLSFPLKQDDLWNEEECSSLLQGVPFSRADVPVLFHCYSHKEDLGTIEKNCEVAIVENTVSKDYSLRIFGYPSATEKAIEEIERCLDNLQIINTDISFDKCKGRAGVLLQFLKIYGTNLFKLKNNKGITSVDIKLSERVIRICGEKQVIPKIEAEIQKVIDNCPDIENIDEDDVCSICYLVPERNDMYRFDLCGHLVCHHECLKLLMSTSEFPLVCPREECDVGITVQDMCVAFNIGNKVKRAFAQNCFNHFMANNTQNYSHCPTINCGGVYKITNESTNKLTCLECFKDICTRCKVEYHEYLTCEMFQRGEKNDLEELRQKGVLKPCPKCKAPIEKNGGCSTVICKCGTGFNFYGTENYLSEPAVYNPICPVPR